MIAEMQQTSQALPPKPRRRRIEWTDAEFIANHVAKGLTETSAVHLLGKFKPQAWFDWKGKGKRTPKIADLFARTAASRQNNLVDNIADVADIDRAKSRGVRHDWRAAQMLAGLHDDRFRNSPQSSNVTTHNTQVIVSSGGEEQLRRLIGSWTAPAKQLAKVEAKQLPEPGQPRDDADKPIDV